MSVCNTDTLKTERRMEHLGQNKVFLGLVLGKLEVKAYLSLGISNLSITDMLIYSASVIDSQSSCVS